MSDNRPIYELNGESLTCSDLYELGYGKHKITLSEQAWERIRNGRKVVQEILDQKRVVYGINTGFGNFADVLIPEEQLEILQENLIRSHAAGSGKPISVEQTRRLLILRINVLTKGYSGISESVVQGLVDGLNNSCLSYVPAQGTLGASGDLAPLSHLALGYLGEGLMWNPKTSTYENADDVLSSFGLPKLKLGAKEGLSLINGTGFICGLGVEALFLANQLAEQADVIAALTLETLRGSVIAYSEEIHATRPHDGQILSAQHLRNYLTPVSMINKSHEFCGEVQDAYSLRCVPQVHGVVYDTIDFVRGILTTEINSATDNPMVFSKTGKILSCGNFHGEYPAKALDYLAIAVAELANLSERRVERLVNTSLSHLPPFLVSGGGLNSGFMIAHCTAAALTSENKTLCFPASCDSIPTSAEKEDHVSMGGWAARKVLKVVKNVEKVLAVELLAACQGIDFLRPLTTTEPLERVHKLVRDRIKTWDYDRFMKPDMDGAAFLIREGKVLKAAMGDL